MDIALCLGLVLGAAFCVAAGWVARGLRAPKPIPCEHQWDVRIGVVQRGLGSNGSDGRGLYWVPEADRTRVAVGQTTVLLTCACGELSERVIPGDAPSIAPQPPVSKAGIVSIVRPRGSA